MRSAFAEPRSTAPLIVGAVVVHRMVVDLTVPLATDFESSTKGLSSQLDELPQRRACDA